MEDGLIKMSRIDPMLIHDTIKTIQMFNKSILSKFKDKKDKNSSNKKGTTEASEVSLSKIKNEEEKDDNEETIGYYDPSLHKRLTILSYSYFQSIILMIIFGSFVIPIYIETRQFVKNENNLFDAKKYFIDDFIKISLEILNLKMHLTNCTNTEYLNFTNYPRETYQGKIIKHISQYKSISNFYQEKYILNLCPILFNEGSSDEYNKCKTDDIIGEYCTV